MKTTYHKVENISLYKIGNLYSDVSPEYEQRAILRLVKITDDTFYFEHHSGNSSSYMKHSNGLIGFSRDGIERSGMYDIIDLYLDSSMHDMDTVILSCEEGLSGDWDCSTEEGREGFRDMITLLKRSINKLQFVYESTK